MTNQIQPSYPQEEQPEWFCNKCQRSKPIADFYKDSRSKNRLRPICKVCFCERCNTRKQKHMEQTRLAGKVYYEKNKIKIANKAYVRRLLRPHRPVTINHCSVDGCLKPYRCSGFCTAHYDRWRKHGDPLITKRKPFYEGTVMSNGYVLVRTKEINYLRHVRIAEQALGKKLPPGAVVHHANKKRDDNKNINLVVCQDAAYHALLHMRMRAVENGCPAHYRKCCFCKHYDDPLSFVHGHPFHAECRKTYYKNLNRKGAEHAIAI